MRKVLLTSLFTLSLIFVLAACGSDDDADYTIGATQIVEHPSLDAAYDGFKDAIEDAGLDVKFDHQSAQNDQNNVKTISDNFVADGVDLIFANSTPSALGAQNATDDIPILFTSVTDAVDTGLVVSMEEPGGNITGVVDLSPGAIEQTIEFIDEYFPGSTIGVIYDPGEQNSVLQIDLVNDIAADLGIDIVERTVANSSEVQQAATSLVSDVDVIYVVTDNTVVSALESVVEVANDQETPLFVGEPDSVAKGGFATFGFEYYEIGYRTGELAVEILKEGKDPSKLAAEYPPETELYINKEAAEAQGIEWNDAWDDAEFVETEEE